MFDVKRSTKKRQYFGSVTDFLKSSRFPTSACNSWKGSSKLYRVDLSMSSLFSTKVAFIGTDFFSSSKKLTSLSNNFTNCLSLSYFCFFIFLAVFHFFSCVNKTLFASVCSFVFFFSHSVLLSIYISFSVCYFFVATAWTCLFLLLQLSFDI